MDHLSTASAATEEALSLLDEALKRYGSTVFWNMKPKRTQAGLLSAAKALETRGDLDAFRIARQIKGLLTKVN